MPVLVRVVGAEVRPVTVVMCACRFMFLDFNVRLAVFVSGCAARGCRGVRS